MIWRCNVSDTRTKAHVTMCGYDLESSCFSPQNDIQFYCISKLALWWEKMNRKTAVLAEPKIIFPCKTHKLTPIKLHRNSENDGNLWITGTFEFYHAKRHKIKQISTKRIFNLIEIAPYLFHNLPVRLWYLQIDLRFFIFMT
jgi:hypothetical protein